MIFQDDRKFVEQRDDEGMGTSDIKYGDSLVYVQHMKTGLWLSYQTYETNKRGVGRVEEKKVHFQLISINHKLMSIFFPSTLR